MAVGREHERDEYTEGHRYTDTQTHRRGGAPYLSLDCTRAPKLLHLGLDGGDGLLERLDTLRLVEGVGSDNVHGRGIELDLDRELFGAALEALAQALLDGLDTLVCEARDLEVGAQADGLRRQTALDVLDQLVLDHLRRPLNALEHLLGSAVGEQHTRSG